MSVGNQGVVAQDQPRFLSGFARGCTPSFVARIGISRFDAATGEYPHSAETDTRALAQHESLDPKLTVTHDDNGRGGDGGERSTVLGHKSTMLSRATALHMPAGQSNDARQAVPLFRSRADVLSEFRVLASCPSPAGPAGFNVPSWPNTSSASPGGVDVVDDTESGVRCRGADEGKG